jgi:Fic family protein
MYVYQRRDWPNFNWDLDAISASLGKVRHLQGRLIGKMEAFGFDVKANAVLNTLTLEVIKSNEIEGEILDQEQVRSSIAKKLEMDVAGLVPADRNVEGVVEMLLDATQNYQSQLTQERMFGWHSALFQTGRSGMHKITVGDWRNANTGPMQVVSGAMGREMVHFEAPEADLLPDEMQAFLNWFNNNEVNLDGVLKAAIAHFWLVTLHPFDDGNGRIARTVADMQLARADGLSQRFYSMSAQIRKERNGYYAILEKSQKGDLDLTDWLQWFLACLEKALLASEQILADVFKKAKYWEVLNSKSLNHRQKLMMNKLLDGFEGKLNTSKWAKIAKTSQDTALRDIQDLMKQEVLVREEGGGRSTTYVLADLS